MSSRFRSKIFYGQSLGSGLLISIFLLSVSLLACKRDFESNGSDGLAYCLEPDLNDLLLKLERHFEALLAESYGRREVGLPDYQRFVEDWNTKAEDMFNRVQGSIDEETGSLLINDLNVRKIVNWSLDMGDSTWIYTQEEEEQLVNQIQFNYQDTYKYCLGASGDSLATAYLAVKDLGDPQYRAVTDFLLFHLEKVDTNHKLLQQLILIELYLRPLAAKYLERQVI